MTRARVEAGARAAFRAAAVYLRVQGCVDAATLLHNLDPAAIAATVEVEADERDAEIERLREALSSIAMNTCCGTCQEAALIARAALAAKEHV